MRTISRSRKKFIEFIFGGASNAKCFSLDNQFQGEPADVQVVKNKLLETKNARLSQGERDGRTFYRVSVHSNLWYEFDTQNHLVEAEEDAPLEKLVEKLAPQQSNGILYASIMMEGKAVNLGQLTWAQLEQADQEVDKLKDAIGRAIREMHRLHKNIEDRAKAWGVY